MKNPIKGALHIAKMRRLGKGPKIADLKGIENSPLMKQRRSIPYTERQPFALGGQPTQNVDATQQQPQNQVQPAAQASPSSFISNVYNQYGGRNPNQDEVNYWQNELNKGSTAQQVYQGISRDAGTLSGYSGQYNAADPNSFRNMLTKTYQSYLGGGPNESDIAFWQNELNKGSTAQQIVSGIANDQAAKNFSNQQLSQWSPSASAPSNAPSTQSSSSQNLPDQTAAIQGLYQNYLGRNPNQDEVNYWSGQLGKGSTIEQVESDIAYDPGVFVRGLYRNYMGRDPNPDESNYWKGQIANGSSFSAVENAIADDTEPTNFIVDEYRGLLGREPNQDELNYWSNELRRGVSQEEIDKRISNDPSSQAYQASNFDPYQVAGPNQGKTQLRTALQYSRENDQLIRSLPVEQQVRALLEQEGGMWIDQIRNPNTPEGVKNQAMRQLEGIVNVVMNRAGVGLRENNGRSRSAWGGWFDRNDPRNITNQILAPSAFSAMKIGSSKLARDGYNAILRSLGKSGDSSDQPIQDMIKGVLSNSRPDITDGATHYKANYVHPGWAGGRNGLPQRGDVGKASTGRGPYHQFYGTNENAQRAREGRKSIAGSPIPQSQTPAVSGAGASGVGVGGSSGSATSPGSIGASSGTPAPPPSSGAVILPPMQVHTGPDAGTSWGGGRGLAPAEIGPGSSIAPANSSNFGVSYAPSSGYNYASNYAWSPEYSAGNNPWGWIDTWGAKDGGRIVSQQDRQSFALGGQPTENVDATQQQPQNQVQQQQQVQQQPQQQVAPQAPMAPPTDRASLISNLYNQYLGRGPNEQEVGYWQGQASPEAIYQGISGSQAAKDYYTGQYNQANPQQYISSLYQNYMGRAPNQDEINYWQGQLSQGVNPSQVLNTISSDIGSRANMYSQMAAAPFASNTQWLNNVYQANMGRNANADEQQYWQGQFDRGVSPDQVADTIANDPGVIVRNIYQGYMGRDPNQDESNYWKGQLARGSTAEQIESSIANDPGVVIGGLYQDYLGRGPNQDEMDYWKGQFAQGATADQIEAAISNDPGVIVRSAYQDYAGRDPTSEETMSGMNLLGPNRDIASFIDKTFSGPNAPASNFAPYQVASASNSASIMDSIMRPLTAAEKAITDMISNREGAKDPNTIIGDNQGPGSGQFSKAIGYKGNLVDMTIRQVLDMQKQLTKLTAAAGVAKGKGSSAVGTGQFVRGTLLGQLEKLGITPDLWDTIKFTPELQKKLTLSLFEDAVTGGKDLNKVDPAKWNRRRLMSQWESFDTRKGKAPLRPAEIKQVRLAQGSVSPMPEGAPGPLGEIVQETTPASGGGGNTYNSAPFNSDEQATQNFLRDYLYDSNVRGTNVLNLGGGSSGGGPGGGSGSGGSSAGTPGSQAGTPGASAIPTLHGDGSQMVPIYKTVTTPGTTSTLTSGGQTYSYQVPGSSHQVVDSYQPAWQAAGFQSQGDYADAASSGYANAGSYYADNSGGGDLASYFAPASFSGQQDPGVYGSQWDQGSGTWFNSYMYPESDYTYRPDLLGLKRGGSVTHDNIRKRGMDALQAYASGGKVWDKKRPKLLGKPEKLSKDQKRSAKAAAKAAGRPYPNLIDNMRAAQKSDGGEIKAALKLAHKKLTKET